MPCRNCRLASTVSAWGAPGFATSQRDVVLTVGQHADLDLQLQVEASSTQVTVQADQAAIEREDPSLSTVTGERAIQQLPLNGRDTTQLALLSPGVVPSRRGQPRFAGPGPTDLYLRSAHQPGQFSA